MNSEAAAYYPDVLTNECEARGQTHSESVSSSSLLDKILPNASTIQAPTSPIVQTDGASDEELLTQLSKGSKEALSSLFQRHARQVFNVAQRILRDTSEAEDLLQELFLFLFQKARLFDPAKASAASWIIQMAYHRAIDRRRYLDSRQHYNTQELHEERLHPANRQGLIDEVAGRQLLTRLRGELSTEQQQTLELHFFEGYSFHEIAEKTGQTYGNVRNHYYRGLERLRSYARPEKRP